MSAAIRALISGVSKYGPKAIKWVKSHIGTVKKWIEDGMKVDWIVEKIGDIVNGNK